MRNIHFAILIAALFVCVAHSDARRPTQMPRDADVWEGGPPPSRERGVGSDVRRSMRQRMMHHQLTEEQEQAALEFLTRLDPEIAAWFREMKIASPMRYRRMINLAAFRIAMMEREASGDSTAFARERETLRLQMRVESLAQEYRHSTDEDARAELRSELQAALDELFDLREAGKRAHLERMTRELERLRRIIGERRENKDEIVERRLQELLGERETMEW